MADDVILYTRPGCTLCDTMKAGLERRGFSVREVNIDDDPELTRQYRWDIPVAVTADGVVIAKHRLDDPDGSSGDGPVKG